MLTSNSVKYVSFKHTSVQEGLYLARILPSYRHPASSVKVLENEPMVEDEETYTQHVLEIEGSTLQMKKAGAVREPAEQSDWKNESL